MARIQRLPDPNKDPNSIVNDRNWKNLGIITTASVTAGAILKVPTTSAANVIAPTLNVIPLTIRGMATQTANLLVIENSAGADLITVSSAGVVAITGNLSVANITAGNWQGAVVAPQYGGTGWASYTAGDLIYASGTVSISKLGIGTAGHFLKVAGGAPSWSALTSGEVTTALTYTPVNKAGDTLTGALTLSGNPSSALHAATKQYVDAISAGIQPKTEVACATTANITLSGEQTIDGVLTSASRVLAKDQSTGSQNGLYVSAAGAWTRTTDMDADSEAPGALVFVSGGTANGSTQWQVSTPAPITLGTTAITWVKTFQAAAYIGGAGLTLSGLTFAVGTASTARIVVNADDIDLATFGTAGTFTKFTADAYGRVSGGTTLVNADIPNALTGKTYNGLTLTAAAVGFTIAGGTTSKTLTVALDASVSGTNTGDQTITLTGDVTGSGTGSFAATVANNAITLAKMATIATDSFLGRDTVGTGNVEVLSVATTKTVLGLTGTNSGDQTITLTGDVTGTGTGSFAATIATSAVTLAKLANLPGLVIMGNNNAGASAPLALTVGQTRTLLGLGTADSPSLTGLTLSGLSASGRVVYTGTGGILQTSANLAFTGTSLNVTGTIGATGAITGTNLSGTNTGDQTITLTGDVTGSGTGSFAATVANNAITLAKMATMATDSFLGRDTALTGNVEVLSVATVKTLLGLTGTNSGDQTITLTGDVTGSGTGSFAATVANNAITLAKMATITTASFLGRNTALTGNVEALSVATAKTLLNLMGTNSGDQTITLTGDVTGSGTGSFAATIANDSVTLAKMANLPANTIIGNNTGLTDSPLALTVAQVKTLLSLTGTNSGDQTITLTGDVTGSGTGSFAATIANDAVTLAKIQNIATASILGRNTAGTSDVEVLSTSTVRTMLSISNVENTALSTWAGSTNITTIGTQGAFGATGIITFTNLTASLPVFTNASKQLVSNAITGSGSVMMSASPTTTGTLTAAAITGSGVLTLSNSSGSAATLLLTSTTIGNGLTIGGDTNLYRLAANSLATDDSFFVAGVSTLTSAPKLGVAGEIGFGAAAALWYQSTPTGIGTDRPQSSGSGTPTYVKIKFWDGAAWQKYWMQIHGNEVTP